MISDNNSIGNYTIVGELARGSFSRIYVAQHNVLTNRMVAIKLMLSAPLDSIGKARGISARRPLSLKCSGIPIFYPSLMWASTRVSHTL